MIDKDLINKVIAFFKNSKSLKYLDPNIFISIDKYKEENKDIEMNDLAFTEYYLKYIESLPKLSLEDTINISREVYRTYGKEKEFNSILNELTSQNKISLGSLNMIYDDCIVKAKENNILLSGTYYDVILLCHEVGHKLTYNSSKSSDDIMNTVLSETPSIVLELAANNYLKEKYNIDLKADNIRKMHILNTSKQQDPETKIFDIIMDLIKSKKINIINLYKNLNKDKEIMDFLHLYNMSIEDCFQRVYQNYYSYIMGYIISNDVNISKNKIKLLDMLLFFKDNGLKGLFSINENSIKKALENEKQKVL